MSIEFTAELIHWRGPAPYHFLTVPPDECAELHAVASSVTYGWGMIPVTARIGRTAWTTSLWPREGGYVVPVKTAVRHAERLELGDEVTVELTLGTVP
jgi:hypothetical protein